MGTSGYVWETDWYIISVSTAQSTSPRFRPATRSACVGVEFDTAVRQPVLIRSLTQRTYQPVSACGGPNDAYHRRSGCVLLFCYVASFPDHNAEIIAGRVRLGEGDRGKPLFGNAHAVISEIQLPVDQRVDIFRPGHFHKGYRNPVPVGYPLHCLHINPNKRIIFIVIGEGRLIPGDANRVL